MEPVDRFKWHRRRFADELGGVASLSPITTRHLSRAASIQQVLEMVKHETLLGRQMDAESIAVPAGRARTNESYDRGRAWRH